MRGAVAASLEREEITFLRGEGVPTSYRFDTRTVEHFFCWRCGIYTHRRRRSDPDLFGVNVAYLDGVNPFDFTEVPVIDGVAHTSDIGAPGRHLALHPGRGAGAVRKRSRSVRPRVRRSVNRSSLG